LNNTLVKHPHFQNFTWHNMDDAMNVIRALLQCIKEEEPHLFQHYTLRISGGTCDKCDLTLTKSDVSYLVMTQGGSLSADISEKLENFTKCPSCTHPCRDTELPRFLVIRCNKMQRIQAELTIQWRQNNYCLLSVVMSSGLHAKAYANYDGEWYEFDDNYFCPIKQNVLVDVILEHYRILGVIYQQ